MRFGIDVTYARRRYFKKKKVRHCTYHDIRQAFHGLGTRNSSAFYPWELGNYNTEALEQLPVAGEVTVLDYIEGVSGDNQDESRATTLTSVYVVLRADW